MKSAAFTKRTIKEILRDPLSYIFCLGFPIVMLIIMTIVNSSIPPKSGVTVFELPNLAPGMAFFGLAFVMLFTCIQVAKDRSTELLIRLHASPMTSWDFITGYTVPVVIIAILQMFITYIAAIVTGIVNSTSLSIPGLLLSIPVLLPSAIIYISFGLIFGTLLNEKSAPGICSIIITVSGMLGNVWMDVDSIGGTIKKVAAFLPFYSGIKSARMAVVGNYSEILQPLLYAILWAVILYAVAIFVMKQKLKKDVR